MTLANIKLKEPYTVYIGRPSIFGNPFAIGIDGNRKDVVAKYRTYASNNVKLKKAIAELKETDVLGCYCHPLPCHGEVIMEMWSDLHG